MKLIQALFLVLAVTSFGCGHFGGKKCDGKDAKQCHMKKSCQKYKDKKHNKQSRGNCHVKKEYEKM